MMKKIDILESGPNLKLSADKYRQKIIDRVTAKLILNEYTEKEAMSMFLWNLSDLEPPVSYDEQLVFCGHYRMYNSYCHSLIGSTEEALEILNIPKDNLGLQFKEISKAAKVAYWEQFNTLTRNASSFAINARVMGVKKKAFNYLCQEL